MKRASVITAALALLSLSIASQANIGIETVAVGDAGNAPDLLYGQPTYGAVNYNYRIGKYEVTAGQYTAFLNAVAKTDTYGLYNPLMAITGIGSCGITRSGTQDNYSYSVTTDCANNPVNFVKYWDACRFTNWLSNGQGNGSTETGAYTLNGYNGPIITSITRNAGAKWAIPTEDEWYKAAYYKGGSKNAGYWIYPTQSNTAPGKDLADASGNNANYWSDPATDLDITHVGEFQNSKSYYGTFDQGGNVDEWNEAVIDVYNADDGKIYICRGNRGGSFGTDVNSTASWARSYYNIDFEHTQNGFRVVQLAPVPEPSSIAILATGLAAILGKKRRKP